MFMTLVISVSSKPPQNKHSSITTFLDRITIYGKGSPSVWDVFNKVFFLSVNLVSIIEECVF
jgi:hypothetical protein